MSIRKVFLEHLKVLAKICNIENNNNNVH